MKEEEYLMPYLIAGVIVLVFIVILMTIFGKKKGSDFDGGEKAKTQNQIIRMASKRLAKDPHDPSGLIPMGNVYFLRQLWEKAFPVYKDLSQMAGQTGDIDPFIVNLRAGICCIKLEKYTDAITYLSQSYNINSRSYEVNYHLGFACFKNQLYEKAVPCFKKALVANPESEGVYLLLGQCLYNTHKYRDSLSAQRLFICPDDLVPLGAHALEKAAFCLCILILFGHTDTPELFRLAVCCMLSAESAVFADLHTFRMCLFVFHGVVVALLALRTFQCNSCTHDCYLRL